MATMAEISTGVGDGAEWIRDAAAAAAAAWIVDAAAVEGERARERKAAGWRDLRGCGGSGDGKDRGCGGGRGERPRDEGMRVLREEGRAGEVRADGTGERKRGTF